MEFFLLFVIASESRQIDNFFSILESDISSQ